MKAKDLRKWPRLKGKKIRLRKIKILRLWLSIFVSFSFVFSQVMPPIAISYAVSLDDEEVEVLEEKEEIEEEEVDEEEKSEEEETEEKNEDDKEGNNNEEDEDEGEEADSSSTEQKQNNAEEETVIDDEEELGDFEESQEVMENERDDYVENGNIGDGGGEINDDETVMESEESSADSFVEENDEDGTDNALEENGNELGEGEITEEISSSSQNTEDETGNEEGDSEEENKEEDEEESNEEESIEEEPSVENEEAATEDEGIAADEEEEIVTEGAKAESSLYNELNTNIEGANWMWAVFNFYDNYSGDINILELISSLIEAVGKNGNDSEVVSVGEEELLNESETLESGDDEEVIETEGAEAIIEDGTGLEIENENEATMVNFVETESTTGSNEIVGQEGDSQIATGEAMAIAQVVNLVNTNIFGENWLFFVVNVFKNWEGNLILPGEDLLTMPSFSDFSQKEIVNVNEAEIENEIVVSANSGENKMEGLENNEDEGDFSNNLDEFIADENEESGTISTGGAVAQAVAVNEVNNNIVGNNWFSVSINNLGQWLGVAKNWFGEESGDFYGYEFTSGEIKTIEGLLKITNTNFAYIQNKLVAAANSGGNLIQTAGVEGGISTGDALAVGKVVNLANTNIVGNNWVYGLVNILGRWVRDIEFVSSQNDDSTTETPNNFVEDADNQGGEGIIQEGIADNSEENTYEYDYDYEVDLDVRRVENADRPVAGRGESVYQAIIVKNDGEEPLFDVKLKDQMKLKNGDFSVTFEWPIGYLDPGDSALVDYELAINKAAILGDYEFIVSAKGEDYLENDVKSGKARSTLSVIDWSGKWAGSDEQEPFSIIPAARAIAPGELVLGANNASSSCQNFPLWIWLGAVSSYGLMINWAFFPASFSRRAGRFRMFVVPFFATVGAVSFWLSYQCGDFWFLSIIAIILVGHVLLKNREGIIGVLRNTRRVFSRN